MYVYNGSFYVFFLEPDVCFMAIKPVGRPDATVTSKGSISDKGAILVHTLDGGLSNANPGRVTLLISLR